MTRLIIALLFILMYSSGLKAQTLPSMPAGGPDNGTYDKPGRYPAGSVNTVNFYSSVAGKNVDMLVYTPPGYSTSQKYGVVYCYQGMGDQAANIFNGDWVKAGIICDNLVGEGKVSKGVIIVAIDDQFNGSYSNVQDMTIQDAIPFIDSHYSTYADADHRGLFGYSWGGGYTFNVGCKNLDYFHYLSPSSAAPNKEADNSLFPNGGTAAKQALKCLFISWGEYDYQGFIDANVATVNYCNVNSIPNYSWVAQGQGHSGGTWRPAIWNFLQLADRAGISAGGNCSPTAITPYIQVNDGDWQQTSNVTINPGDQVKFGPQPSSGGSWSWNGGCGTSGTSREQTIYPTGDCDVVATYTNSCGAQSTQTFQIRMSTPCSPTAITPYIQVNDGDWQQASNVTINPGDRVKFGPQPSDEGSWSWNGGCGTSGTSREQTIYPTGDCDVVATYANSCGAQSTQSFQIRMSGPQIVSGGTYTLTARHSGKALDVTGAGTTDGTNVEQWTNYNSTNQQWILTDVGSGYYRVSPANASGRALDVNAGSTADGANVQIWAYGSGSNQQWQFVNVGDGYYQIKVRNSGKCLDVSNSSIADGANVQIWSCNSDSYNQQWSISSFKSAQVGSEFTAVTDIEKEDVLLYPNPFTSEINLRIGDPEQMTGVDVLDIMGKKVEAIDCSNIRDLQTIGTSLRPGIYVVQVCRSNQKQSFKIVKK